jgi:hypothetical protein
VEVRKEVGWRWGGGGLLYRGSIYTFTFGVRFTLLFSAFRLKYNNSFFCSPLYVVPIFYISSTEVCRGYIVINNFK